jgi:hypothetical protein
MSPVHYHVCRLILKLDLIPRYGRIIRLRPLPEVTQWRYMRYGFWGFYLLDRFDWLDLFELESEYRHAVKESNG